MTYPDDRQSARPRPSEPEQRSGPLRDWTGDPAIIEHLDAYAVLDEARILWGLEDLVGQVGERVRERGQAFNVSVSIDGVRATVTVAPA